MTNTTHWWWMGSSWSLNCLGDRRIDGQKRGIPETRSGRYSLDPGWYQWYHSFIKIFIILFKKNLLVNFKLVIRLSVFQNEPWSGYYSTSLGSGGRFFIKWVLSFLTGTSILIIFHHPEKVETLWSKCTWDLKKSAQMISCFPIHNFAILVRFPNWLKPGCHVGWGTRVPSIKFLRFWKLKTFFFRFTILREPLALNEQHYLIRYFA